jgi:hypothetical protein
MGAYRRWVPISHHTVKVDEVMKVLWSDYYGAALFGDENEIACLPHKGCRLEIVAAAESSHHEANLILPGQVVRYQGSFILLGRFEFPSGIIVGLWHLIGFKLRLARDTIGPVPSEDAILDRARGRPERVTVG